MTLKKFNRPTPKFLKSFSKKLEKMDDIITNLDPPKIWYSTGNYALNKILSGSFMKGIPLGRTTVFAGVSGSGKSFLTSNIVKNAQNDYGACVLYVDTEGAIDESYLERIGTDVKDETFKYVGVTTLGQTVEVISTYLVEYEKEYGKYSVLNDDAPPVIIVLDSLDQILTESENENFEKGDQKGDQGQNSKQKKLFVKSVNARIKRHKIAFLITHQVYVNQDLKNNLGMYVVNNALRYTPSTIVVAKQPGKVKDTSGGRLGVELRLELYKSRFSKEGVTMPVEVPFTTGINPFSGFLDLCLEEGILKQPGNNFVLEIPGESPISFSRRKLEDERDMNLFNKIMAHPKLIEAEKTTLDFLSAIVEKEEVDPDETPEDNVELEDLIKQTKNIDPETGEILDLK